MKKVKKEKKPKKKPIYSLGQNLLYYYKLLRRHKSRVLYMVFAGIPLALLGTLLSTYTPKLILDRLAFSDRFSQIAFVIAGIFLAQFLLEFVNHGVTAYQTNYDMHVFGYLIVPYEKKIMEIDYESMEDPKVQTLYDKANAAVSNNHTAAVTLPGTFARLVQNILQFVIFSGVLATLPVGASTHSRIPNPLVLLVVASTFLNRLPQKLYRNYEYRTRDARSEENRRFRYFAGLSNNFGSAKDVRLFGMREWIEEAAEGSASRLKKWMLALENRGFAVSLVNFLVTLLRNGAAYAYLIFCAVQGTISAGDFVLYFSAITSLGGWFTGILSGWNALHTASLQLCDYREYIELPDKFHHGKGLPLPKKGEKIEIVLRQVSYTYPEAEKPALHGLNLTLHGGEKLAIVGKNGAGKTTLVKLLCGLYTPTEGEILVNGHRLEDYDREEYYSLISAMFQTSSILPMSIGENIAVCEKEQIDGGKLQRAVTLSGLAEKLQSLPKGADTPLNKTVHEDGTELSGGELQRLLLARAIYKDAPFLVLDEPTSALDPIAESEMYEKYNKIAEGKTAVFISHRLASTRFCDRILLLEDGVIAEEGTHASLLAADGKYAALFKIQSRYYQDSEESEKEEML